MKLKTPVQQAFSLVEIMFVVTIIGLLAVIVLPSLLRSREESTRKAVGNNLLQIYNAKLRWALENKKAAGDPVNWNDITDYLRQGVKPVCPDWGAYTIGVVGADASCSVPGHALPAGYHACGQ